MKWAIIILPLLAGCAPYQASQNADQLISNISDIREKQVVYNIGRAIDDTTMVPAAVVITQGTAQTTQSLGVTLNWAAHFVKSLSSLTMPFHPKDYHCYRFPRHRVQSKQPNCSSRDRVQNVKTINEKER